MSVTGTLLSIQPPLIEYEMDGAALGDGALVEGRRAEVVAIKHRLVRAVLLDDPRGLRQGDSVKALGPLALRLQPLLQGRLLDFMGAPLDGQALGPEAEDWAVHRAPPAWLTRPPLAGILVTGTRSIDSLLTMGRGQRVLWVGARGTGAKAALAKVARESQVDTVVWASIGDDGWAIRDMLEQDFVVEGPGRPLVVAAGAEQTAAARLQCGYTALAVAEYLREQGQHVLLILDRVDQWMEAFRELTGDLGGWGGLMVGRGRVGGGLGPLPQWLARCGPGSAGSISAILRLQWESDSWREDDLAVELDARLEGRVTFSRRMALRSVYPAVDILESVSRCLTRLGARDHLRRAGQVRSWLAHLEEHRESLEAGLIQPGQDSRLDEALGKQEAIERFLRQMVFEASSWDDTQAGLQRLVAGE